MQSKIQWQVHNMKFLLYVGVLFMCVTVASTAQPLTISLSIMNRPGNSIADWISNPDAVIFRITNPRTESADVRVVSTITKENTVVAQTKFLNMPVLSIPPGTVSLSAESLFPPEAIEFSPQVQRTALRGGLLPPGTYSVCIQLYEPNIPDSTKSNRECKNVFVTGYDVPILLEPSNYTRIEPGNPITFRWKGVQPHPSVPKIVRYKVFVYEVKRGQDPFHAAETAKPIYERFSESNTPLVLYWQPSKGTLNPELDYVWTVQALDMEGKPYGQPDGRAEPAIFKVMK